jgi:aerobic-type carbon monoxide dehydrogenase small subunit (CoxS/CutS family)
MIKLEIDGQMRTFGVTDDVPLLWALRDVAHITGTKFGCGMASCGAASLLTQNHEPSDAEDQSGDERQHLPLRSLSSHPCH